MRLRRGPGCVKRPGELAQAAGFTPTLAFEGEDVGTLRGLIAAGLGVAVLPVAEPAPPDGFVEIPLRPRATRPIGLVWANDRPMTPAVLAFRGFVTSQA